jgi:tRNA-2-methylthio-N6-dimethylallyladenosine synthase
MRVANRGYDDASMARPRPTNPRRIFLETFGCQMNELDSELVRGHLDALGYRFTDDPKDADVILYNTCSVREQAENKVLSRVGRVGIAKREGSRVVLGVIGCMAEREGASMIGRYPQVDLMCGPGELDKLPMLIDNALKAEAVDVADRVALQGGTSRRSATLQAVGDDLELLDLSRAFDPDRAEAGGRSAYVRITRGCNKFCTYCVVPNTRGPEVHRPPDAIVDECRMLADAGVIEVTLLGQTVNHYVYTHGVAVTVSGREAAQVGPGAAAFRPGASGPARGTRTTTFADLLARIHDEVPAIERLRFVTSFPRDFGDDILSVMAASPRICRYLHAPAQSGSNAVLKRMNRGYSREQYLEFAERARAALPDVCIAGDVIVGFCGETEAEYEETRTLLEAVRFKNNFIFKYSPRPGTAAFDRLADDVPEPVKRRRNNELLALQAEISAAVHTEYVGRTVDVFVGQVSEKAARRGGGVELGWETPAGPGVQMSGRTGGDLITVFDLPDGRRPEDLIGRIVPVRVTGAGPLLLRGELERAPATSEKNATDRIVPAPAGESAPIDAAVS